MRRYKYRKIKPADIEIMKKLREAGFGYKEIGAKFGINMSSVMYHLNPKYKEESINRAYKYWNRMSKKEKIRESKKHQKYKSQYLLERYQNDKEFHDRFLENVKNSQHRIRKVRLNKKLCLECGGKREDKENLACRKCRLKYSNWDKARRIRNKTLGLCSNCGRKKLNPKFKLCEKCREKERKRRNKWVKEGRCYTCGKKNDRKGVINCSRCKEKMKFYHKKHLLNKGKKALNT